MRYLCIDRGQKRTGLAVGDDRSGIATPLEVIITSSEPQLLRAIETAIEEQGPDALVAGLPLNMDGSEGPAAAAARKWAQQLQDKFGLPVFLVDERLTSQVADAQMSQSGLTHKQKKLRRDALAAAAILRVLFQHQNREEQDEPSPPRECEG